MRRPRSITFRVFTTAFCVLILPLLAAAQSTDQNFPTPVTTNEISGTIKARDVGDSRLTSYFYAFNGGQGDVFINVVTRNFSGDIDVFTADNLRPLAKIVLYADAGVSETGRLIYLRKGEPLLLRVEGRSPNDDAAVFQIKFAGSFIALAGQKTDEAPKVASLGETDESGIRVNSVGTIVAVVPKPLAPPKTTPPVKDSVAKAPPKTAKTPPRKSGTIKPPQAKSSDVKDPNAVFENDSAKVIVAPAKVPPAKPPVKPKTTAKATKQTAKTAKPPAKVEEPAPDPLASIRLVIQLKDGNVIQRPMSEVVKFSVDKGVLVIVAKNGKIVRYSILDVAKVTIE